MTRSDRDVERLLEDWLDAEGRPIPQQVLEASLEAVSRTSQVRSRGGWRGRWFNQRQLAIGFAALTVVLVIVAAPTIVDQMEGFFGPRPGAPGPASQPMVWDAAADFGRPPNQANPGADQYGNSAVWSYLRSGNGTHDPVDYFPLPNFDPEQLVWSERDLVNLTIGLSPSGDTLTLHGWSDGNPSNNHHAIVGWRSPISGTVTVAGAAWTASDTCPGPADGMEIFIDRGGETLYSFHLDLGDTQSFNVTTTVAVGESLYVLNDPGGNSSCDGAVLLLAISR